MWQGLKLQTPQANEILCHYLPGSAFVVVLFNKKVPEKGRISGLNPEHCSGQ
jgi:hypothetical protein